MTKQYTSPHIQDKPATAERLFSARKAMGWSLRAASERLQAYHIHLSHTAISKYEKGTVRPTGEVLSAFAAAYDRPINWLLGQGPCLKNVKYRNLKSKVTVRDRQVFEGSSHKVLEGYGLIESYMGDFLGIDESLRDLIADCSGPIDAAQKLRSSQNLSASDPVPSMIDLLEQLGVRVVELDSDFAIDGLAAHYGNDYAVVLNWNTSNDRCRLNAGHELWHILAGDCDSDTPENKQQEQDAFVFASHLLLTSDMLAEAFKNKSMVRLVQFRERFGISLAAMIYRAQEEKILEKSMAKRLWIEFSKRGWRRREPGEVRADRALRFETLIDRAIVERDDSLEDISEVIGMRVDEIRSRLSWATGSTAEHDYLYNFNEEVQDQPLRISR